MDVRKVGLGLAALVTSAIPTTDNLGASAFGNDIASAVASIVADGAPGVIVLRQVGGEAVSLAAGLGNIEDDTPLRVSDRLRAGSLVKSFVSVVVLQLAYEDKLGLDDPIVQQRRCLGQTQSR
jgi:D-alanyl-D-alanine carboxypeptidase